MPQGTRIEKSLLNLERLLEQLSYEDRLRQLEKRRLQRGLITQDLKRAYKKDREQLLTQACSDRTRGSGFELSKGLNYLLVRNSSLRGW